ncbi:WXG100 family type VII secretion target [Amycolatopsis lurida]
MTDNSGDGTLIDQASAGVQDLAAAATAGLEQAGPAGALVQPVVELLRNVWEGYFGSPIPPDGTNWNAYTHDELYRMLWDNADVGEVSSMAAEWGRHGSELSEHGEELHTQRGTLRSNWSGGAADLAADRLGQIGDRTADIGSRANTVHGATQDAGDALAVARNTMPPPAGDPLGAGVAGAAAGAGAGAAIGAIVGAGAGGVGAGPGALMGAAIGAVAAGGASYFLASAAAAEQKAQAVHVMQRYEASLNDSSRKVTPGAAASMGCGVNSSTTASGFAGAAGMAGGTATGSGGLPWSQLVGSGPLDAGTGSGGGALARGMAGRGSMAGMAGGRGAAANGMMPGAGGGRGQGAEDEVHVNRLPTIDQRLFHVEEKTSSPVIGL